MPGNPEQPRRFGLLAQNLEALASEPRLELLHSLRTPRALHEIRVGPSQVKEGENPERPMSRQAVTRHLEQLQEAGLVLRDPSAGKGRGEAYVLNHERLFALVDEIRNLAKLRPATAGPMGVSETVERSLAEEARLPPGPRLVVAYGREDGVGFALEGSVGASWTLGRRPDCSIRLDYDPYASALNATLERTAQGFVLHDAGSRNGTWVNWERLPRRGTRALRPGDVVGVGRSLLVFQEG